MPKLGILLILVTATAVTSPLVYFGLRPTYLSQVLVQPDAEGQAQIFPKEALTKPDATGVAFFNFQAHLTDPSVQKLFLEIRPIDESTWYPQGEYRVDNGLALGVVQLGSQAYPLRQNEQYFFQLKHPDGRPLLTGRILANVHPIAGGGQLVMVSIGLLASVIQILSLFISLFDKKP